MPPDSITTAPPIASSGVESQEELEIVSPEESETSTVESGDPTDVDEPEEATRIIAMMTDCSSDFRHTIISIDPNTGEQRTLSTLIILPFRNRRVLLSATG